MKNVKTSDIIFATRNDAEEALDHMEEIAKDYGRVTLCDLKDLAGLTGKYLDIKYYWTAPMLKHAAVYRVRDGWIIKLIDPIIENKDIRSTIRYSGIYKSPNTVTPTKKPEPKPVYIVINTEYVEDVDDTISSVFAHAATCFSREVHITVT